MDEPSASGETLRQDSSQSESSRRLSGREGARQDPSAPAIDGYTLTAKLGAGAYGEVWKAWQKRTGKWVAVKVFPRRHGVDWLLLQREVERLIKLDKHPHVVSLLDADLTGDPPYFAMELMEGGALTRFVDPAHPASPEQAARWAEQIAEALCYVHSKGVLHCDLKPANVLLDDQGRVRVADFGQSRIASESTGALGTLYFMAPEQALTFKQNEHLCPDVRWDLFGLGATLYAVLTGRAPHEPELRPGLEKAEGLEARLELYRNGIRAAAVPTVAADEDLAAIVRGCLEPWPEKRYATSGAVLSDLAARRESRPVSRLAGDSAYRLRRFARRNSAAVALGGLLAVAIGIGAATVFRQKAALQGELANAYALRARAASDRGDDASAAVLFARSNALHPSGLARRSALAHLQALERPLQVWALGAPVQALALNADGTRAVAGGDEFEAVVLDVASGRVLTREEPGLLSMGGLALIGGRESAALPAEFSRDGARALAFSRGSVGVFDAATGKRVGQVQGSGARFRPDGKVMVASGAEVRVVDPVSGAPTMPPFRHAVVKESWEVPGFDLSADGKTLVTCLKDRLQFHDAATAKPLGPPLPYDSENGMLIGPLEEARFSPDGRLILSITWSRAALLDRLSGRPVGKPMRHDGQITAAAFSPSGLYVFTAGEDGTLRRWHARKGSGAEPSRRSEIRLSSVAGVSPDAEPGQPAGAAFRHGAGISAIAISADERLVATAGVDGVARLWNTSDGVPWGREMLHAGPVLSIAFSADARTLVTGGRDGTARAWRVPAAIEGMTRAQLLAHNNVLSLDTLRLAGEADGLTLYEAPSMKEVAAGLLKGPMGLQEIGFSGDGSRVVAVARGSPEAVVFDADGKRLRSVSHADGPKSTVTGSPVEIGLARLDATGKRLLTGSLEIGLRVWDVDSGKKLAEYPCGGYVYDARFSPAGDRIAISTGATEVRDALLGERLAFIGHGGGRLAWSPDGSRLATSSGEKREARLWDASSGAAVGPGIDHEDDIETLLFSPDGGTFASASRDGSARLIDASSGRLINGRLAHGAPIRSAAMSQDGSTLATGGADGSIRFWDTRTGEPVARGLPKGGYLAALWFARDSKTLMVVGNWHFQQLDVPWLAGAPPPGRLMAAAESITQRAVGPSGSVTPIPFKDWDRAVLLP